MSARAQLCVKSSFTSGSFMPRRPALLQAVKRPSVVGMILQFVAKNRFRLGGLTRIKQHLTKPMAGSKGQGFGFVIV